MEVFSVGVYLPEVMLWTDEMCSLWGANVSSLAALPWVTFQLWDERIWLLSSQRRWVTFLRAIMLRDFCRLLRIMRSGRITRSWEDYEVWLVEECDNHLCRWTCTCHSVAWLSLCRAWSFMFVWYSWALRDFFLRVVFFAFLFWCFDKFLFAVLKRWNESSLSV